MPVNLAPSKPDGCRRHIGNEGSSAPGKNTEQRATSPLTIAGVTLRVPSWLPTWWNEFTSDKALMVEVISRAVFPLMFFVFNVIYWPWYMM